jgi:hypothetical protein
MLQNLRPAASLHLRGWARGCQLDRLYGRFENGAQFIGMLWIPCKDGFDIRTFFDLLQA